MKLFVCAVLALSSFAVSPTMVVAGTQLAATCGPDVPEAMRRPGGYCDIIQSTDNIGTERNKGDGSHCQTMPIDFRMKPGVTVLVAGLVECCRNTTDAVLPKYLPQGLFSHDDSLPVARERVALNPCDLP